jgi:hypothetical protein
MPKSFKDYYAEDKEPIVTEGGLRVKHDSLTRLPEVNVEVPMPPVQQPQPVLTESVMESVKTLLNEQREESKKLLGAANKTNKKILESVNTLVEATNDINAKLIEAITSLSDTVAMLEGKIDEIKNIEIPTPIVNLQMPSKKTIKNVHRDKRGMITHIEESEVFDEEDDSGEE